VKSHLNKGLFSNYYLEELLPREEEFKISLPELEKVIEEIKCIWDKKYLSSLNEPQLRKHFLDKVFETLGWTIDVEPPTPSGEWSKHPDYALFHSMEDLKNAQKATKEEYFKKSLCIGEAKRWERPLDKKIKVDPEDPQNPSLQISRYLWLTEVKWGILTDGRYWRLYERETSKRLDIFYEIDLENLIENGSIEDFKYFYLFFRRHAFPYFLEKVYKESVDYAEAVGEALKENVYQALKTLAQGFLKTPENDLKESRLKEIHDNSLILLYRLLFILYAEYRGLLPLLGENQLYTESYSLDALKKEIADRLDRHEPIATSTHGYWNKIKELFEIINTGNSELGVPPYNGGLFDPDKHEFLEKYRVGDLYIAKAVDLLSRSSDRAYIDYGSLEIRHLGSIYEGLLEYRLKIAEEKLVSVKEKGKEVFIHLEEAKKAKKKIKEQEIVSKGEVYLVTDKGERKATGSYYTPDYIVNYIIDNTLGPLVQRIYRESKLAQEIRNSTRHFDEIFEEIVKERGEEEKENLLKLWNLTRGNQEQRGFLLNMLDGAEPSHGYDPLERILQLKILDPAMGSGHFLVEATDYLARELLKVLSGEPLLKPSKEMVVREAKEPYGLKEPEEEDIRWARREVVERCIFGVDLNPLAVELAKLSLWLYTVAKNRPLNFLDHHLRCGNSLIGARIDNLASLPELKKKKPQAGPIQLGLFESIFKEKVNILLGAFGQIEGLPSDTVEQIREKEKFYNDFRKITTRFQDVADVWTSVYFGNDEVFNWYAKLEKNLRATDEEWERLSHERWFKKAKEIADEKRFFHWELEFPEVFFEGHQRKENPGFDAVVGNPPWASLKGKFRIANFDDQEALYLSIAFPDNTYMPNLFEYFIGTALKLVQIGGRHSFIVPDRLGFNANLRYLRSQILQDTKIKSLLYKIAFPDVTADTLIYDLEKAPKMPTDWIVKVTDYQKGSIRIPQSYYAELPDNEFLFFDSERVIEIIHKLEGPNISLLDKLVESTSGFGGKSASITSIRKSVKQIPVIKGENVQKYLIDNHFYFEFKSNNITGRTKDICKLGARPKVLLRKTGVEIISAYDDTGRYPEQSAYFLFNKITCEDYKYLLCLLNSKTLTFYYWYKLVTNRDSTPQLKKIHLDAFPIRRISFVTRKDQRERLVYEAKKHYKKFLERGNSNTILHFVESRLIKEHKPDPELVKKHNVDPLNKDWQFPEGALWEQSDVVHDILTFLAEQMIEMNKEKQEETKGYLEWLESQLKIQSDAEGNAGIEALTGKTQIKNYLGDYQKGEEHLSFDQFWKILEKNKTRIQANLKSRELYENIRSEYEKSLTKLLPLKEKLRKTDWLIDQIVYKLYGLTEEEIKIVEENR